MVRDLLVLQTGRDQLENGRLAVGQPPSGAPSLAATAIEGVRNLRHRVPVMVTIRTSTFIIIRPRPEHRAPAAIAGWSGMSRFRTPNLRALATVAAAAVVAGALLMGPV